MVAWTVAGLVICSFYTDPQFTSSCNSDLHGVPNCVWTGLPRYACSWFGCSGLKKGQASNLPRRAKYAALLMAHACHHTGLWNTTLSGGFFFCLFVWHSTFCKCRLSKNSVLCLHFSMSETTELKSTLQPLCWPVVAAYHLTWNFWYMVR